MMGSRDNATQELNEDDQEEDIFWCYHISKRETDDTTFNNWKIGTSSQGGGVSVASERNAIWLVHIPDLRVQRPESFWPFPPVERAVFGHIVSSFW